MTSVYGLHVDSDLPLPCPASSEPPALRIAEGRLPFHPNWGQDDWDVVGNSHDVTFFWVEAGAFRIQNGEAITYTPQPAADPRVLVDSILGECCGVALCQRSTFVLHASAVLLDGELIVIAGDSGCGKSTLAAFLAAHGAGLVSDDLVVFGEDLMIPPGLQQLKLHPKVLATIGKASEEHELAYLGSDKRIWSAPGCDFPTRPRTIVFLRPGNRCCIDRLSQKDALFSLISNAFPTHLQKSYGFDFLGKTQASYFQQAARIADAVPCFDMSRPQGCENWRVTVAALLGAIRN